MLKKLFVIIALSLVLVSPSRAVLTIEITQGVSGASPIAIVPFEWVDKGAPPEQIHTIVGADLQRSGFFKPLPKQDLVARPHRANEVNYKNWRALNVDHLVVGRIQVLPDDNYQVQFQLLDVHKRSQLAGYSIRSGKSDLRRTAHQISDIIYKAITGKPGAFDTRIAYITVTQNQKKKKSYRLAVADSDGHNEQVIYESKHPLMSPSWAPDGKRLVYVSFTRGRPEVYIQNIVTRKFERIVAFKGLNSAPVFSPDGSKLALTLSKDGNPEIYILDMATKLAQLQIVDKKVPEVPAGAPIPVIVWGKHDGRVYGGGLKVDVGGIVEMVEAMDK